MNCLRAIGVVILFLPYSLRAAEDPLSGIRDLLASGRAKEARVKVVAARDAYATQSNATGEATAWLLLGMTDAALDDGVNARAELEQAVTKFTASDEFFGGWMGLLMLAQMEKGENHFTEAIAAHERALALLSRAGEPQARFSIDTLRILAPVFAIPTENFGPLAEHPEVLKPMILRLVEIVSRDEYGSVLVEAGELDKAEAQLAQANTAASMFGGAFDVTIAAHVGDLRRRQWRFDEARASYVKALGGDATFAAVFRQPSVEMKLLGKLADLEVLSGRVDEALVWNDRAMKIARDSHDAKREAAVLEDRAELLQNGGRLDAALTTYEEALALATRNTDLNRQASIHAGLGALHMFQGNYGTSVKEFETAIGMYQTLDNPYVEAALWAHLSEVHMLLELDTDATSALANARALAKKSGFKLADRLVDMLTSVRGAMTGKTTMTAANQALQTWWDLPEVKGFMFSEQAQQVLRECLNVRAGTPSSLPAAGVATPGPPFLMTMSLMLKGKMLLERGEYEAARTNWLQALEMNPSLDHRAGLFGLIGASYWVEGKRDEGIRYFTLAAKELEASAEDVKVEEMLASYLGSNRRWYYGLLIDMMVHEGRTDEAFAQAERARARAFLQMVGNHRLNAERGADPRLLREAETVRTQISAREREAQEARGDEATRMAEELAQARERYRTLLTRVKVSSPEYEALTNVEPVRIEEVRDEVPADTTLISYFVGPKAVHAWVINRNEVHYTLLPLDTDSIRRITCWAGQFGQPPETRGVKVPGACSDAATAEEAFDRLIAPLLGAIHQQKLMLVPHGVLHYVPFAALRNRESGRYLLEDFTLTYAPSASALRFLRAKESPVDGGALILGDPVTTLRRLPGAAQEASAVARTFAATPHIGQEAREDLLYGLHGQYDLVHLAAHGIYDPANPLFSRIALAESDTRDGSLTVHEILSSVDLTGVNLVVLSACQSAVGARSGGDEVVGLTRALLYAGTPGVISTLWNIDDTASAALMDELYRRLTAGVQIAEALRQAQLAVRRNEQTSDPKYWAAFMLSGDPQGRWKPAKQ